MDSEFPERFFCCDFSLPSWDIPVNIPGEIDRHGNLQIRQKIEPVCVSECH